MFFRIADDDLYEQLEAFCAGQRSGTYRLLSLRGDGTPIPVRRMLGDDPDGTLYIGASATLPDRVREMRQSILAIYSEGGEPTGKKKPAIHRLIPDVSAYRIDVTKHEVGTDQEAEARLTHERAMFKLYTAKFGEFPPFN